MKWWGWGDPQTSPTVPEHAAATLRADLELEDVHLPPIDLEDVHLRDTRLSPAARNALEAAVGVGGVRADREARMLHAAGKSYADLIRQRAGDGSRAPDAVVSPPSHEHVRAVLTACAARGVAVVPFGGGTSVVGGVDPDPGPFHAVISLDLGRLDGLVGVDDQARLAVVEPGMRGPELEGLLSARGMTLGHFPQSYEFASVGGYVATRSAGQASTGYGRIDSLVRGVRLCAPAGDLEPVVAPASAAGPALRELVVGSEGALGVITQATLDIAPAPAERRYEGWFVPDFETGIDVMRSLVQDGAAPAVARLSDEEETRLALAQSGDAGVTRRLAGSYLRARGVAEGCLIICGWEGSPESVATRRGHGVALLRRAGAVSLGQAPGRAWEKQRYSAPYLRDDLLTRGVMVETLETATTWSSLHRLYRAVGDALSSTLAARGTPPIVACHVSHLYRSGASLYFTFMARQERGAEIEQWAAAKSAACDAITAEGGTLTHHHAVGRDHAPWMPAEVGPTGIATLRALKAELDPLGIMNPGKLLPDADEPQDDDAAADSDAEALAGEAS
jgi:alkyldihydroxyacetonephosphate synthase